MPDPPLPNESRTEELSGAIKEMIRSPTKVCVRFKKTSKSLITGPFAGTSIVEIIVLTSGIGAGTFIE